MLINMMLFYLSLQSREKKTKQRQFSQILVVIQKPYNVQCRLGKFKMADSN